ncbi:MAG: hypothetical protein U1E73_11740 [Planctomycetota bacterium]
MQRHRLLLALSPTVLCSLALSQTIVVPNGYSTVPGNVSNIFPYGDSSTAFPGLHIQFIYDSSEFTNQAIGGPIAITGVKMRAYPTTASWTGGTFATSTVSMSTAAVDYAATTTNYAANHGGDLTVVYSGPIVVQPGTGNGAGVPGPWHIDIVFTTPFLYDPAAGDLAIEFDNPSPGTNWSGGTLTALDHTGPGNSPLPLARRVYGSSAYPAANGVDQYIACLEFGYSPGVNFAQKVNYGSGCYDRPRMAYEQFPANTPIDLVNTQQTLVYAGSGNGGNYVIVGNGPAYDGVIPPLLGVDLAAQPFTSAYGTTWDDASVTVTLPIAQFPNGFPFPGAGSPNTSQITINSNGKVMLGATSDASFATQGSNYASISPFQGTTGAGLATLAVFNVDLDPTVGGHIWYESPSPSGGVRITWADVPNWLQSGGPVPVINQLQMELLPSGTVTFAYGSTVGNGGSAANDGIVGFSAGGGQPVTTMLDWSSLNGFVTGDGSTPLQLDGDNRPVLGTSLNLTLGNIPAGTSIAALIYGLTKFNPGIDLTSFGMPGCRQYCSSQAVVLGIAPGTSFTRPFAVPNSTGLAGVSVKCQGAAYAPGVIPNAVGASSSNGVELVLDIN